MFYAGQIAHFSFTRNEINNANTLQSSGCNWWLLSILCCLPWLLIKIINNTRNY